MNFYLATSLATKSLELVTMYSKFVSKTAISKKEKVADIGSSINLEEIPAFYSLLSTPSQTKMTSQLIKFETLSIAFEKLNQFKTQIAKLVDRPLNKIKTNKYNIVQITIDLPDNLPLTEVEFMVTTDR